MMPRLDVNDYVVATAHSGIQCMNSSIYMS